MPKDLSPDYIASRIDYNPDTGEFRWKPRTDGIERQNAWNTRWAGKRAGNADRVGRVQIRVNTTKFEASHVAWVIMTGSWPENEIDHIDCDPANNSWCNLREATRAENMRNTRISCRNTSGFKGVCFDKSRRKWMATIKIGPSVRNLGRFASKEEAAMAYAEAAVLQFGAFARVA